MEVRGGHLPIRWTPRDVEEGVTWSLRGTNEGTELHAHVWANSRSLLVSFV